MKNLIIVISALLLLASCQNDFDSFEETTEALGKEVKTKGFVLNELPTSGQSYGIVIDVNNNGIMVGDGVWVNDEIRFLDSYNSFYTEGNSINNQGQIVGMSVLFVPVVGVVLKPSYWNSYDSQADILPTGEYKQGYARDINEDGIIVGFVFSPGRKPAIWENGELTVLPLIEGGSSGWADGINLNGDIVGMVDNKPVIWKNRIPIPLESYGTNGIAWQINDKGQIVGQVNGKPVYWNEQLELTFLDGRSGVAWDINNIGDIVGSVQPLNSDESDSKAALWKKEKNQYNKIYLFDKKGFDANGLNESGLIVGVLVTGTSPAYEPLYWTYE